MYRYFGFDAKAFLKDSKQWDNELAEKKLELESITEIGGISTEHISGGDISKPVEKTSFERFDIETEIERLEKYKECLRSVWKCLDPEDVEILTGFYFTNGFIHRFVDEWVEKHTSNRQYCYNRKRQAEKHLASACVKWMEKHGYDV